MPGVTDSLAGALRDAHQAVHGLAEETRRLGERHQPDHDVRHLSTTLSTLLDGATATLAAQGQRHDVQLAQPEADDRGLLAAVREKAGQALGHKPLAGALLLADLRHYLAVAADTSIACIILAQGAQAAGDRDLLDAVTTAHDTVLRTHRWALTRLKTTAPQVLTTVPASGTTSSTRACARRA
jgi:hypothetical protein